MNLAALQTELENIYEVSPGVRVDDFLITDQTLARALDTSGNTPKGQSRDSDEKLLVCQEADLLRLSLYLDAALLARLRDDNPIEELHDGNLSDFCLAIEGVSHFLYLAWNAGFDKPVTTLELETQAEVDKFVTVSRLLHKQGHAHPRGLHDWLFARVGFAEELPWLEQRRYRLANDIAARYCRQLENEFLDRRNRFDPRLYANLRRFYRLTYRKKLLHIGNGVENGGENRAKQ